MTTTQELYDQLHAEYASAAPRAHARMQYGTTVRELREVMRLGIERQELRAQAFASGDVNRYELRQFYGDQDTSTTDDSERRLRVSDADKAVALRVAAELDEREAFEAVDLDDWSAEMVDAGWYDDDTTDDTAECDAYDYDDATELVEDEPAAVVPATPAPVLVPVVRVRPRVACRTYRRPVACRTGRRVPLRSTVPMRAGP